MTIEYRLVVVATEASREFAPIPAEPPFEGVIATIALPALLLAISVVATFLLYKRFSRSNDGSD